ncbi:MAG: response regulator [Actinomycetota bacterium]|nr:response regulator [Actinomycetota bacterium]
MKEKVLIVDDDATIVNLLATILEMDGFQPCKASSGEEAFESIDKEPPDLVLLDIMMPEMDGLEFLSRLRSNPMTEQIPVVILTVLSDREDVLEGWLRKADGYVTKPFDPRELEKTLRNVLDRSEDERVQERARRLQQLRESVRRRRRDFEP